MSTGPVELIIVKFPGNQLRGDLGDLALTLKELVDSKTIRVIDLVLVRKDAAGKMETIELTSLEDSDWEVFEPLVDEVLGIISNNDIDNLSALLENDSSGAIMLFENVWAIRFRDSLVAANGKLIMNERVPRSVMDIVLAAVPAQRGDAVSRGGPGVVVSQLQELNRLKEAGALTDDEFTAAKARVLSAP